MVGKILTRIYITNNYDGKGLAINLTDYKVVRESDKSMWVEYVDGNFQPMRKNKSALEKRRVEIYTTGSVSLEALCYKEDVDKTINELFDMVRVEATKRIEGLTNLLDDINNK